MNRERMIDDAATAGARAMRGVTAHVGLRDREFAAAALAVFEEAHAPTDDEREDEHQAQMVAFESAKLEARNSMRHDPHVWHEALEDALDKVLPAVWHAATGFRRTVQGEPSGEVLVEGSWFKVTDLPTVLGNYMRSSDEYARQVKDLHVALTELKPAQPQGQPSERIDALLAQANEHGIRVEVVYPQGDAEEADLQAAYDAVVREYAAFRRDRQEQMTRIRAALDDAYVGARTGNLITPHWVVKSIDDAREAGGWTLPPNRPIRHEEESNG